MKSQISSIKQKLKNFFVLLSPILKFEVQEDSMSPTLKPNDVVLVYKFSKIKIGDLVVFKNPEDQKMFLIKRVKKIKAGKYFMIGDNLKVSRDSRHLGLIGKRDILGKVILTI